MDKENRREQLIEKMILNMVVLRTMLHLTQDELASLLGMTRQTLTMIETRKRKMTWTVYLALLYIFSQSPETKKLLEIWELEPGDDFLSGDQDK